MAGSIKGSFSHLVKPAEQACKIEEQSFGFAQERPCDCFASMEPLSSIFSFSCNYCMCCASLSSKNKLDIKLIFAPWLSSVKTNYIRGLNQILLMPGEWFLVLPFQAR